MKKIVFTSTLYMDTNLPPETAVEFALTYGSRHQEHFFGVSTIVSSEEYEDPEDDEDYGDDSDIHPAAGYLWTEDD